MPAEDSATSATSWPVAMKIAAMALAECAPLLFGTEINEPTLLIWRAWNICSAVV